MWAPRHITRSRTSELRVGLRAAARGCARPLGRLCTHPASFAKGPGLGRACALGGPQSTRQRDVWLRAFGVPGPEVSPVSVSWIMTATCASMCLGRSSHPTAPRPPRTGRLAEGFRGRGWGWVSGTGGPWASDWTTFPEHLAHECPWGLTWKLLKMYMFNHRHWFLSEKSLANEPLSYIIWWGLCWGVAMMS